MINKDAKRLREREYYKNVYKDKRRAYWKQYWEKNKDKIKEQRNSEEYKENAKLYMSNYMKENKEKMNGYNKKSYNLHKDELAIKRREKRDNDGDKLRKYFREYNNNRKSTDVKYNLSCRMATALLHAMKSTLTKKSNQKWQNIVGYSLDDLKEHLNKTMPDGYNWNDYLSGKLHIDHIIPQSKFNYDSQDSIDFRRCWAIDNLRLLPAKENISKGNKLSEPFQPSLKICQ